MHKISLVIILTIVVGMPLALAQEETLSSQKIELSSDNSAYQEGDVITITAVSYTHLTLPTILLV